MIIERKQTEIQYEILDVIKNRWSPRAFEEKAVEKETLNRLFEAMRWAPSSMNEQPWRVIYAHKGEEAHKLIADALMPGNQPWAKEAPVLMVTLIHKYLQRNGRPNGAALHDLGLAIGNLSIQATAEDLGLHQMGGFDRNVIIENFGVGEEFEPITCIALGYFGDPESLPDPLKARELAPRQRKTIKEFTNHGSFNNQ